MVVGDNSHHQILRFYPVRRGRNLVIRRRIFIGQWSRFQKECLGRTLVLKGDAKVNHWLVRLNKS